MSGVTHSDNGLARSSSLGLTPIFGIARLAYAVSTDVGDDRHQFETVGNGLRWTLRLPRWGHKWVGFHGAAVFRLPCANLVAQRHTEIRRPGTAEWMLLTFYKRFEQIIVLILTGHLSVRIDLGLCH